MIELASSRSTRVDADLYDDPERRIEPVWSVDSRWIAYSRNVTNHLRAIFLYSLEQGKAHQVTDSSVDAIAPAFDRDGQYLYFLVSTDYAQSIEGVMWLGMSALDRPTVTRTIYAAVLSARGTSPRSPSAKPADPTAKPSGPQIDIEGLAKRIVPLDAPTGDYVHLTAGPAGTLFYTDYEKNGVQRVLAPESFSLQRYDVRAGKAETFLKGVDSHVASADGSQILYREAVSRKWMVAAAERLAGASDTGLDTSGLSMQIEPRVEWQHIFREAWRAQRDDFYQATLHGADWQAIYEKYAPLLPYVNHRADLGYLIATVGGELTVGHSSLIEVDDGAEEEPAAVGMLGADYGIEHGRYRIRRIYTGDQWDPESQAPLAAVGVDVKEGDYLLEVNGKPLLPPADVHASFEGTVGKPTQLRVGRAPRMKGSRLVTVVPVSDEEALRTAEDWVEKNRRRVNELSGGRIAYVWLPNTGPQGYQAFNRQYYSQLDKVGVIIDERYNQGGYIPDYIVDVLARPLFGYLSMRNGAPYPMPVGQIYGPKVMLINESAGSGGDALPYYFRLQKAGPLIGTHTWGGLVGPTAPPPETLDGGGITVPSAAFYDRQGRWLIENEGIAPDIEVENTPAAVIAGRDPQLERAVEEALKLLKGDPQPTVPRPAPPDRVSRPADQ